MELIQLFIHAEAAHDTFDELGQKSLVDFRDVRSFDFGKVFRVRPGTKVIRVWDTGLWVFSVLGLEKHKTLFQ